ncbi:46082_t:CDS:2 [Gigaspora margarita]|uniref:46082_t:CDS:1 n=1 Tax=Gigaspora margarita TaxID=4874 RepID=A0ABN7UFA7_GIGMA|nr:46082_t:CDS:2 [Gigaspora margarita]
MPCPLLQMRRFLSSLRSTYIRSQSIILPLCVTDYIKYFPSVPLPRNGYAAVLLPTVEMFYI